MSNGAFEKDYSDDSFWDKVKNYAKSAGEAALEPALKMYYAATDADTPPGQNHYLWCARIFHFTAGRRTRYPPLVGYTDDVCFCAAVAATASHIKAEHVAKAKR